MFDLDQLLEQAVKSRYPTDAVTAAVKRRIRPLKSSVQIVFVNADSPKILKSAFKRHEKLMQKIA